MKHYSDKTGNIRYQRGVFWNIECLAWVMAFRIRCIAGTPTDILHCLVQLGVHDHANCGCTDSEIDYIPNTYFMNINEPLTWLHLNHVAYNREVYAIIKGHKGLIGKLRRVLRRDLQKKSDLEGYGEIVLHAYAQELLNNFVRAEPNPAWVNSKLP